MPRRVLIMGAAGKDFHTFNTVYRGDRSTRVVAFTAAQIPGIDGRRYPAELAGADYPEGIPIEAEGDLERLIADLRVDHVVFSYSDVTMDYVTAKRRIVEAAGATFDSAPVLPTMLPSKVPVIAVCAVRTGVGKSQTTRRVAEIVRDMGKRLVAIRHPMPYGDLVKQRAQRFATLEDLELHECTIEEMEEYEPHIRAGSIVMAGVDYGAILEAAEAEADVILWDGGNNDLPFYRPDLHITLVDPLRPGHELTYYPGRANLELADVVLFNKMDSARPEDVEIVRRNVAEHNPGATIVYANSKVTAEDPSVITGRRVLVVEDGPTLTHGEMSYGAGIVAARRLGAAELVDPRPFLQGSLKGTFETYPGIGTLLPAMGYGRAQMEDLRATIEACDCDSVVVGTPIDLSRVIDIAKPHTRVTYDLEETSSPGLAEIIGELLA